MGLETTISWTGATWNPWRGCDKVSPGCAHCYMFTQQRAYGRDPSVVVRCGDSTFYAPLRSRKWREPELPAGSLVFTCSWSDWFHEDADPWRDEAWDVIRQRPDLVFQVLTKRPERIAEHLPADWGAGWPNVWLGVSIESRRYVHRARTLADVPAVVHFISAEPLLGPLIAPTFVDLTRPPRPGSIIRSFHLAAWEDRDPAGRQRTVEDFPELDLAGIEWLIIGGESGGKARRFDIGWARQLILEARQTDTAVHVKQLGAVWARAHRLVDDAKAEDMREWPADLRVREYPDFELAVA